MPRFTDALLQRTFMFPMDEGYFYLKDTLGKNEHCRTEAKHTTVHIYTVYLVKLLNTTHNRSNNLLIMSEIKRL